ncbi:hypothetical protein PI124_g10219 [Phytophthora idaei]|nr:hypothetical protein PI124_g10219 [Phytophthora idaei]
MQKPALIVSRYVSAALKRNVMPQTTRNIIANLVKNDPAEVNLHQLFNKFCVCGGSDGVVAEDQMGMTCAIASITNAQK